MGERDKETKKWQGTFHCDMIGAVLFACETALYEEN